MRGVGSGIVEMFHGASVVWFDRFLVGREREKRISEVKKEEKRERRQETCE